MQRKNNILRRGLSTKNRSAMAMIMAIAVIVTIATIMALSLSLTAQSSKRTTDIYLYEQAILYSKSAAELALEKIAKDGKCTTISPYTIDTIYNIKVDLKYVYKNYACSGTDSNFFTTLQTDEQNGSVLMDITVTTNAGTEPIRYFRRSIQKL
jgi:hypothetical protein